MTQISQKKRNASKMAILTKKSKIFIKAKLTVSKSLFVTEATHLCVKTGYERGSYANSFFPFLRSNITEIKRCQILNTNTFGIGIRVVKSWKFHSLKSFKVQIARNSIKSQSDFYVTCTNLIHLYMIQLELKYVIILQSNDNCFQI